MFVQVIAVTKGSCYQMTPSEFIRVLVTKPLARWPPWQHLLARRLRLGSMTVSPLPDGHGVGPGTVPFNALIDTHQITKEVG